MSLDATGTLGNAVTFSKWKGRNYVRERVIPANPKSGAQVGRRAMFKFLTQYWSTISDANQATWQELAEQLISSRFNAYQSQNMQGWHNFLAPSKVTPATRITSSSDNALDAATYEENRIRLDVSGAGLLNAWGIIIFAAAGAAVTPAVGTAIMVEPDLTFAAHQIYWTPPTRIQYTFDSITFSIDGKKRVAGGPQTANP